MIKFEIAAYCINTFATETFFWPNFAIVHPPLVTNLQEVWGVLECCCCMIRAQWSQP